MSNALANKSNYTYDSRLRIWSREKYQCDANWRISEQLHLVYQREYIEEWGQLCYFPV